jgi:hypothetical protein
VVAGLVGVVLLRARHTETLADACFGQLVCQVSALALLRGIFAPQRNPREPIDSVTLNDAQDATGARSLGRALPV